MRMTAASVDKGDVVLCLSLSGYSPEVEAAVQIAKDYGSAGDCHLPGQPFIRNWPMCIYQS